MSATAIVLVAMVALAGALWVATRASAETKAPAAAKSPEQTYRGLREQALSLRRSEVGIPAPSPATAPWGVVMDMGQANATVTVVAFGDGNASIYFSSGGGRIGGGQRDEIGRAALAAVAVAARFPSEMRATTEYPAPAPGETRFYLRTDGGVLGAGAPTADLGNGRHPLAPLFHAMQEVITQYRLLEERGM